MYKDAYYKPDCKINDDRNKTYYEQTCKLIFK